MWRVYYADGSTYQGRPEQAPERGVIGIVHADPQVGRFISHGKDFYIYQPQDCWWSVDIFGLWDYLASPGWKRVLFGRLVAGEEYDRLVSRMIEDPDFPPKSAWADQEARP